MTSGGESVAFDTRHGDDPEKWPIVMVPFGDLEYDACVTQASCFAEWDNNGFKLRFDRA